MRLLLFFALGILSCGVHAQMACQPFAPAIDGCSDYIYKSIGFDDINIAYDFQSSCNRHDYCYREIGSGKTVCDNEFRANMKDECKKTYTTLTQTVVSVLNFANQACKSRYYRKIDPTCWINQTITTESVNATLLNACNSTADTYFIAVSSSGDADAAYKSDQIEAISYAQKLANAWRFGSCTIAPMNANIFKGSVTDQIDAMYKVRFSRSPSTSEGSSALNLSYSSIWWQWQVLSYALNSARYYPAWAPK